MRAACLIVLGVMSVMPAARGQQPAQPATESAFVAAVVQARQQYNAAANDMQQGGIRATRKTAICQALRGLSVTGWVGTIYEATTNGDGNGVVEITIAPDVYVMTWNNSLSDVLDHTLIPAGSAVFNAFARMKKGDAVKFSGIFMRGDTDCVEESSMSMSGSMTEPEFPMRFTAASVP
jgi:hypothetical protein